jgi:hypothetical protein
MQNIHTITANLTSMARDLEDAKDKADKLNKKGSKASAQKLDLASSKLDSANSQWESQAPFIFETLQAVDESRVNQLRDLLTQFQTHESDMAQRSQLTAAETLAAMLEIDTAQEIQGFAERTIAGRPALEKRPSTRAASLAPSSTLAPPTARTDSGLGAAAAGAAAAGAASQHDDDDSEASAHAEGKTGMLAVDGEEEAVRDAGEGAIMDSELTDTTDRISS